MTDEELVKLYKEGDEAAFEQICERYKRLIASLSRTLCFFGGDSEDLVQEGFLGLMYAAGHYDEKREGASSFGTYAYLCVRSKMKNSLSHAKESMKNGEDVPIDSITDIEDTSSLSPEDKLIDDESIAEAKKKIESRLSDFEKRVFDLYFKGCNYIEISKKLGVSQKSVDNALHRIKKKSRNISC